MQMSLPILLLPIFALTGCQWRVDSFHDTRALTAERRAAVEGQVRRFAGAVAHDVTQDGPAAWGKYFSGSPDFFMAVNGKLAFPDGQAAAQALPEIARVYKQIELHWGGDLRVDALTPELAAMATPYEEAIDYADGHHEAASGYFTSVVELQNGKWEFRDAHWSAPVTAAEAP